MHVDCCGESCQHRGMKDLTAVRIEGELIEGLKRVSAGTEGVYSDRSVNWLIGRAVKEFLDRELPRLKHHKGIEAGLPKVK